MVAHFHSVPPSSVFAFVWDCGLLWRMRLIRRYHSRGAASVLLPSGYWVVRTGARHERRGDLPGQGCKSIQRSNWHCQIPSTSTALHMTVTECVTRCVVISSFRIGSRTHLFFVFVFSSKSLWWSTCGPAYQTVQNLTWALHVTLSFRLWEWAGAWGLWRALPRTCQLGSWAISSGRRGFVEVRRVWHRPRHE